MSILGDIFAGGAEGIFKGVSGIISQFKADPTVRAQLEAELAKAAMELDAKLMAAESAIVASVNATMQAEARSEHWAQWLWRPLVGFSFVVVVANNYVLMPYLQAWLTPVEIPTEVWYAWLSILGVTAGFRGLQKWQQTRNGNGAAK